MALNQLDRLSDYVSNNVPTSFLFYNIVGSLALKDWDGAAAPLPRQGLGRPRLARSHRRVVFPAGYS